METWRDGEMWKHGKREKERERERENLMSFSIVRMLVKNSSEQ